MTNRKHIFLPAFADESMNGRRSAMSCWRRTTVLRIPASILGFQYRRQWDDFLKRHDEEFDWDVGYFNEALCDDYPLTFDWHTSNFDDPDWVLDQRSPDHPEIVPGPFLDYCLDEIIPLHPEFNSFGQNNAALPLEESEMEKYLPLYQKLFPHLTMREMEAVRWCEYEWYDGTNAPYLYSDLD